MDTIKNMKKEVINGGENTCNVCIQQRNCMQNTALRKEGTGIQRYMEKDAQHHEPSWKCKVKPTVLYPPPLHQAG